MNILNQLRASKPLVLNITNLVSMEFVANGLLALGASPIMSQSVDEIDELVSAAHAVVINIGTLDDDFVRVALRAGRLASVREIPLVLDPVGVGATRLRTHAAKLLLSECRFSIVRGNASEIMALADERATTKGVDSCHTTADAVAAAKSLSTRENLVVVVSGQSDFVVNANSSEILTGGSEKMTRIAGMGCLLTAVAGAMLAVHANSYEAAISACHLFKKCGEKCSQHGPGSFKAAFIDELYTASQNENART